MFQRIRAAWRAFWATTTAISTPEPKAPMRIAPAVSMAASWEARRHNAPMIAPDMVFARPEPMPGVLPANVAMAMDYGLPSLDQITATTYSSQVSEGLGFLGFPYLAELSQRAEYRKIASIWAKNCVRKWIKLSGDDAKVEAIEAELIRLDARDTFRRAIEKECYFGRCQVFFDFDDFDRAEELAARLMIDPAKVNQQRPIKRLSIVEPMWSYPGRYDAQNPLSPDFYKPSTWYVSGRTVHASRLITMVGHEMPTMLKPAYAFGGVSLTQMCKPYVDNWLRNRQSASDLLNSFSVMVLKTDMESVLAGGVGDALFDRVDMFNKMRDNRGTFVLDKAAEDFANVSAPIAGLDKLVAQSQEQMSSVSSIPLSVLLGITPTGLNASSDGEIRVFYDAILSYLNEVCRPGIETLLDIVQLSLFGEIDDDVSFEFETLWEMSDKDKADIRKSDAEAAAAYINGGVIDPEEERERLNNEDGGAYNGMLDGPAPEPVDDGGDDPDLAGLAGDGWITTENGSHILLDDDGTVIGGAGGKMNGRKLGAGKPKAGPDPRAGEYHPAVAEAEEASKVANRLKKPKTQEDHQAYADAHERAGAAHNGVATLPRYVENVPENGRSASVRASNNHWGKAAASRRAVQEIPHANGKTGE